MTRPKALFLSLVFMWLGLSPLWAGEGAIVLNEEVQLRVAEAFMAEEEFYWAITEFKRFLILFPDSEKGDYALLQMGSAYLRGGENDQAARNFHTLQEKYPASLLTFQSRYLEGLAVWKGKKREQARGLLEALANEDPESPYAPSALAAMAMILMEEEDPRGAGEALEKFLKTYPDHPRADRVREAEVLLAGYLSLPQKSEILAGVLSGILPGAGYVYAGELATGFMSLAVNGAFIAATGTALAHGLEALGVLAGGVGLPFYIGNIYGSALAVRKWNQAVRRQARDHIYSALNFVFE